MRSWYRALAHSHDDHHASTSPASYPHHYYRSTSAHAYWEGFGVRHAYYGMLPTKYRRDHLRYANFFWASSFRHQLNQPR